MNTRICYDVKPRADSAYVKAPFDEGKKMFEEIGYRIPSAEENARLRIEEGEKANVSKNGNWVLEGFIYVPKKKNVYFTKRSPIMENPRAATQAHRKKREFYPTEEQVERAIYPPVSIKIPYTQKPIPTNRFAEDEVTIFAFGQTAQAYGDFLEQAGIKESDIYLADRGYVNHQEKAFAQQLWLLRLSVASDFQGNWDLFRNKMVRGVPKWEDTK
jgi:hypothetical protein